MRVEGSLGLSVHGQIIRYSKALEDILGYKEEEVLGGEFTILTPKADWSEHKRLLEDAKQTQGIKGFKTRFLRKDHKTVEIYISLFPLRTAAGKVHSYMLNMSMDKTEETPAILTDEFQRIFKYSNDSVAVTDRDGHIIDVNKAFLDLYGYTRDEVLGHNPRLLKSEHSTPDLYEKMWSDILDPAKGYWKGEIINRKKDGTEVPVFLSLNAIRDVDGDIKSFLGISFDMTRAKELERVNQLYMDYIVHDIRGPLTSIMANSELLMMQLSGELPDDSKKKLRLIVDSAERINTMVSDILDYVKLQSGALKFSKKKTEFSKVWKGAVEPFRDEGKKITLTGGAFEGEDAADMEIEADAEKLTRVIYNLLRHAFKNAKEEVRVYCDFTGSSLECSVTDDGKDFSEEDAEAIFDTFYHTEDGVKAGGAGLGLSIVKSFIEAHGGKVWVEKGGKGEKGGQEGAKIAFTLPV
jgi:PAS domain S-box-containing protein